MSSWLELSWWQFVVSLLVMLMLVVVCAGCGYLCCGFSKKRQRQHEEEDSTYPNSAFGFSTLDDLTSARGALDGSEPTGQRPTDATNFDLHCPLAFVPPAYSSLAKDPPKYSEIFGHASASQANLAFDELDRDVASTFEGINPVTSETLSGTDSTRVSIDEEDNTGAYQCFLHLSHPSNLSMCEQQS